MVAWVGYHFLHDIRFLWMVRGKRMEEKNTALVGKTRSGSFQSLVIQKLKLLKTG